MSIQILPDEVVSQIAAGEVVERPASVVKELIENSIDAGAKTIEIHTLGAGQQQILVQDNGQGIPNDELQLAVTRHATSKLIGAQDLFEIQTLGFRGEALASIGSVSILTVTSKVSNSDLGARIRVEGGKRGEMEYMGAPNGTSILVENLFFNVPARKKFLKTDLTERRHIDEVVQKYALSNPAIRFTLTQEGRTALQTSGMGDRKEIVASIFGVDIAKQMLELRSKENEVSIEGLISPVSLSRSNRKGIQFFVNGRPVLDAALTAALLQGYHTLLMVGRYPIAQLLLTLPPDEVDVNVHPTKAEVRFQDRNEVFLHVQRAVRRALLAYTPIPEIRSQYSWEDKSAATNNSWGISTETADGPTDTFASSTSELNTSLKSDPSGETTFSQTHLPLLRLIGQVASAYLIAEGPDGLYLIDQHAAHERVLFERFLAQQEEKIPSQRLLESLQVELTPSEARLMESQLEMLGKIGFEVEYFGKNSFLVRAVPAILVGIKPEEALRVLVEDFEEDETPLQSRREEMIIARVCKRAAIKAGQVLSPSEQKALLRDLELTESPRTCPHGRPTMIHLSVGLLERQFGRRGSR